MIAIEKRIQYWLRHANKDLKIGYSMYDCGYYSYVTFMCHQVIEKIFKAAYVKIKNATPPFTHGLTFLAQACGFWNNLTDEQQKFLAFLNPRNVETRYPGEDDEDEEGGYDELDDEEFTQEEALDILNQTKTIQLWIQEKILST